MSIPRILIAGLRGGSGKTLIALGLLAAWRKQGCNVAPFKKGPDYIDAAWLSKAADTPCRNLDLYLMSPQAVVRSFLTSAAGSDVAAIEGNRGLYDGMDSRGSYSTAELAKLLRTPVLLAVDCTKATRTIAALVFGCQQLDPEVQIGGVILNQTAGKRHESVVRDAVEQTCGVPVLGSIGRMPRSFLAERHLGLVPPQEHEHATAAIEQAASVVEQHLDLDAVLDLARRAPALELGDQETSAQTVPEQESVCIGVFRDEAFQFYYPENFEALVRAGARLIEISPLSDKALPELEGLYIGGGFPETLAGALADNTTFLDSLRRSVGQGLPVYAECGGAVYLGKELLFEEKLYAMAGVLPARFGFRAKPQGHGYVELETVADNPFFSVGDILRGHEFHYTYLESSAEMNMAFAFRVRRGQGIDGEHDGLCLHNVLASYTHLHALGTESWAPSLVRAARMFRSGDLIRTGRAS